MVGHGLDNRWFVNFALWQNPNRSPVLRSTHHKLKTQEIKFIWTSVLKLVPVESTALLHSLYDALWCKQCGFIVTAIGNTSIDLQVVELIQFLVTEFSLGDYS